jgi:tetratricopeptide (TPR) repeat protein
LKEPNNIALLENLAMLYHETGNYKEAIDAYERVLSINDKEPGTLNNLAWLLVTVPDENLKDPKRGLELAKKAIELERTPTFLDTLAEAYWVNGDTEKAIDTIKEAISLEKGDASYYKRQLDKFMSSAGAGKEPN